MSKICEYEEYKFTAELRKLVHRDHIRQTIVDVICLGLIVFEFFYFLSWLTIP